VTWAEIEAVFAAALDTPPNARESLLASCTDESVRAEVRRLLARHDSPGFLDALDLARATALLEWDEGPDPERVGRYGIVRRLGRGGTGIVYLARDSVLDRDVALKLLAQSLSADGSAARRFAEEARAASALDHPNIARVYELGHAEDGRLFIAMAYHEGETLRDRIGRGPLPVDEAIRIAAEIADGLSVAHAKGIVHRDIKPENVLLTARGACIVDFGIAKVLGHTLTRTGAALGTAAYMSPEQTRGVGVDHRSDVWSLGVLLYETLTGVRPFQADGGEALVYAIRHDAPKPVTDRLPHIAPALARVVDRCLTKEPERRYPSAAALLSALRAPGLTSYHRSVRHPWKWVVLAVGGVGVSLATLLAGGRHSTNDRLVQVSTVLPMPQHPGAVAILPFGEGPGNEPVDRRQYLVEGIAEGLRDELIGVLSSTPGLRVTDRASVRLVADAGGDVQVMSRRLGVSSVLRWSLFRRDSSVTVSGDLVRAADGRVLWSRSFRRPLPELGSIAEEVGQGVASVLGLPDSDSARVRRPPTKDPVAYGLYLRGRFAISKWTPAGLDEAALLFRQAIARDSGFALAYTWLADVYVRTWSGAATGRFHRVQPLVLKALEIDSTLAFAHRIAGYAAAWQDRDWAAAERHLSRALALDSSDIWNYHFYASYLAATGRTGEALAMARRATAVDPVSSVTATQVGFYLFLNRQYPEAIAVLERAMQVDTTWWQKMPVTLGRAYLAMGRTDEAVREFRRAGLETSHGFEAPALLAYALGTAGRTQEARALAAQYVERARGSSARPLDLVAVHLGQGDTAQALDWLERLPDDRGSRFFLSDPLLDPVRDSPRFQRVLERLNLDGAAQP
jgi:tetratricopeptide (TPR) repeat protein/TolB-like protein